MLAILFSMLCNLEGLLVPVMLIHNVHTKNPEVSRRPTIDNYWGSKTEDEQKKPRKMLKIVKSILQFFRVLSILAD